MARLSHEPLDLNPERKGKATKVTPADSMARPVFQRRGGAARVCALVGAPTAAKAVLDTLLALPAAQGKRGAMNAVVMSNIRTMAFSRA